MTLNSDVKNRLRRVAAGMAIAQSPPNRTSRRYRHFVPGAQPAPAVTPVPKGRRTLAGYLLMPRPKDLFKALLMPLTFGLGVLAAGGVSGTTLVRAVVVLAVLELLVYPARYQWNDIRGFVADQRHPAEKDRGRLPGPVENARQHITASCVVAGSRLALTAVIAFLPGLRLGGVLLAMTAGVFGVAIVYEVLRAVATGRTGEVPSRITAGLVLLWVTVGAGYVVRGLTGLALAVDLGQHPALGVAAAVTLWAYGVAFVTCRWAIEATAFARLADDRIRWSADAGHAREHLLGLVRWLPTRADPRSFTDPAERSATCWAALRGRTPVTAPWNLAMIVAGAAAAVTGRLLTGSATATQTTVAAVLGALAALGVVTVSSASSRAARTRLLAVIVGAAVLMATFTLEATGSPVVAVVPWLAVLSAYVYFVSHSLRTMGRWGGQVRAGLRRMLAPSARLVFGRETWSVLATTERVDA
jgi:hypothetical protein